jgi:GntR family transcriptional regulator
VDKSLTSGDVHYTNRRSVNPPIDPARDRPVYKQIADQLRAAIQAGDYPPGSALPSETALARTFGVTRTTARQAVDVLKAEALVRPEHGRGVFVRHRPQIHRLARNRLTQQFREAGHGPYEVEVKQLGLEPSVELVEVGPIVGPADINKRLGLRPGQRVLIRRRKMYAGGEPMQLGTSYVPWSFAKGTQMVEPDTGPGGLYSRLADVGHKPERFIEEVSTRMATEDEARFLGFSAPQPVFFLVRTAIDATDTPVEVCEMVMAGDRWLLSYEWPAD